MMPRQIDVTGLRLKPSYLDVIYVLVETDVLTGSVNRTDDADGDRVFQLKRTSHRDDPFAGSNRAGTSCGVSFCSQTGTSHS